MKLCVSTGNQIINFYRQNAMKKLFLLVVIISIASTLSAQSKYEAKKFADAVAYDFMKRISPLTGYNSYSTTEKITYTRSTGKYKIYMDAYWYGYPCIFCDETVFNISGMLIIARDGSSAEFMEISRNEAVSSAMIANNILQIGGEIIINNIMSDKSAPINANNKKNIPKTFHPMVASRDLYLLNDTASGASAVKTIRKGAKVFSFPIKNSQWNYIYDGEAVGYVKINVLK